jgi:stage II sporulation protein D
MHFAGLIILFFVSFALNAQQLEVGIFRGYDVSSIQVTYNSGDYELRNDTSVICELKKEDRLTFKRSGDKIQLSKNDNSLGSYPFLMLQEKKPGSSFGILPLSPSGKKARKYMNNLNIGIEDDANLKLVNEVEMSNYLAGVIESEGGGGKHIEYYKVQAILSRTYALDHLHKHQKEGFQLCDQTHCQAYHNMLKLTPSINDAVLLTNGIVMIDKRLKLADGFFFANCGGQTSESDFVWNVSVPYCKSIRDTFCIHSKQAHWEKRISKSKWEAYLLQEFGFPVSDSIYGPLIYTFNQPSRAAFYLSPHLGIPLRDLRVKFDLKSTWFSCYPEGEELVLKGHGFGHGVGLCQEGAMKMAQLGYSYQQILEFYFTGIYLINYYELLFLDQEVDDHGSL